MNIQDFVSETLREIGAAVIKGATHPGIDISPRPIGGPEASTTVGKLRGPGGKVIVFVDFDLSVLVQAKLEGEMGAGISVIGIGGAKSDFSGAIDQAHTQRVKFQIPILLKPTAEADTA